MAAAVVASTLLTASCAHRGSTPVSTRPSPSPPPSPVEEGWTEKGIASWYGEPYHRRRTASGEVYDMHAMTAAHKTLPFGTVVKVDRRDTGADVKVRINDRGPFIEGRIIDLSYAAAKIIGLDIDGVAPVKIKVVGREDAPLPSSQPPPEAPVADCFWVQIGAFSERDRALRVEAELETSGEVAVILEGLDELWRVRLGPFDEKPEAERTRNRITDAWPGSNIVPCG
ncbi:MAG: septal ring lytic transglycosylase RlpA family protein [Thermoanaerobaculales bacterium]|nr:septal ring lytic transglycosylase RlpA family protein [Thermoanaerobaculales bacterium]